MAAPFAAPQQLELGARPSTPPGYTRRKDIIRVPLRKPKHVGGQEFYGDIPRSNATFAHAELCATGDPEYSLAPVPEVAQKTWYNTYVYIPEQRSHLEEQFLERFVQGPDGEWLDVVKARRMYEYMDEQRRKAEREAIERKAVQAGLHSVGAGSGGFTLGAGIDGNSSGGGGMVQNTQYRCPYSGEPLLLYRGELKTREELMAEFEISDSLKDMMVDEVRGIDFDNLRIPWPFGRPYRNKKISQHAYDWFDRRNPFITSDKDYQMLELPSVIVDQENYGKWRGSDGERAIDYLEDVGHRAGHIDDYPYKM